MGGRVMFKGRSLMSATIGRHELRDSTHIIPERLASFQKDNFDYVEKLGQNREQYKAEIIRYCLNDCKYLYKVVRAFIDRFGREISIGSAALKSMKKIYDFERLGERSDEYLRPFFFGGRVQEIAGAGHWHFPSTPLHYYDVNSMYPSVMAHYSHPIGANSVLFASAILAT